MQKKVEDRFFISNISFLGEWNWFEKEKCIVCSLAIKDEQLSEKVYCPHCRNPAHKSHLLEWIKLKGICPLCRQKLDRSEIITI